MFIVTEYAALIIILRKVIKKIYYSFVFIKLYIIVYKLLCPWFYVSFIQRRLSHSHALRACMHVYMFLSVSLCVSSGSKSDTFF